MRQIRSYLPSLTAGVVASLLTFPAGAVTFTPTNLVTDDQLAHAAQITDIDLKNAWGMSYAPGGPFWVSSYRMQAKMTMWLGQGWVLSTNTL